MNAAIQPERPNIIGLSHICIFVDDMEQAVDYYRQLLGWSPTTACPTGETRAFSRRAALWTRRTRETSPSPL